MMMSQIAEALGATLHGQDVLMTGVSRDTRDINQGDLYIAIKGDRFDGHAFVAQAGEAGAVAALVSDVQQQAMPQLQVADTRQALGQLASYWRDQFHGKLIGITGSNGKTTVKEMCRKILADFASTDAVLSTRGNYNNDIGMPLMLLELREQHEFAVIEMGANHVGEIDYLSHIAKPDIAILNNVGPAHLEGFGSLDNTARAKAEIYDGLKQDGIAIINQDDVYASFWLDYCKEKKTRRYSMQDSTADVFAHALDNQHYRIITCGQFESASAEFTLQVPGKHNVMNALAAATAALCAAVPLKSIAASLASFENIGGRLTLKTSASGVQLIDDSYNANPLSVSAAIDVLAATDNGLANTYLVLGDMAELGEQAEKLHHDIGKKAKTSGIKHLYATGSLSLNTVDAFGKNGFYFDSKQELATALLDVLSAGDIVLVKGSRSAAMEEVVERILTHEKNNKRVN